jgi:hypothetical protein
MPRHLRPVGDDERMPDKNGSIPVVIEDLEVAHGHVVEAQAEAQEVDGDTVELLDALHVANAAVTRALKTAHHTNGPKETP